MPDEVVLEFSVLNFFADPHPQGVYPQLLASIAHRPVRLWGNDFVAITPPEKQSGQWAGLWSGRILVWTEIDPDAPTIDTKRLQEIPFGESNISVPDNIGLNGRIFSYVLREKDHMIFFESKNELGRSLSPYRLVKPLDRLFMRINARGEMRVEINVFPEEDALEKVLGLKAISTLEIHIRKPNPDDNDEAAEEILKELEREGARKKEIKLTARSRKKGLKPSSRTIKQARVAAETDYVATTGTNELGDRVRLSTEQYPKTVQYPFGSTISALVAALRVAKDTLIQRRPRRAGPN